MTRFHALLFSAFVFAPTLVWAQLDSPRPRDNNRPTTGGPMRPPQTNDLPTTGGPMLPPHPQPTEDDRPACTVARLGQAAMQDLTAYYEFVKDKAQVFCHPNARSNGAITSAPARTVVCSSGALELNLGQISIGELRRCSDRPRDFVFRRTPAGGFEPINPPGMDQRPPGFNHPIHNSGVSGQQ